LLASSKHHEGDEIPLNVVDLVVYAHLLFFLYSCEIFLPDVEDLYNVHLKEPSILFAAALFL